MWKAFELQKLLSIFHKNISVFGYKVVKHLPSWPLTELVKLTMLWTTEACLGKSYSFDLLYVSFVNVYQFVCLFLSLLVLRDGYGIWLY